MNKATLVLVFLLLFKIGFGQIPDGSIAPNFTLTDIHGNSHTLYDYLDSGKSVLINLASTGYDEYAGQSFLYFAEGHLNNFQSTYGPNGTDEVMVLMLETDPGTPIGGLYGEGNTFGDWESYANFPIISNDSIGDFYPVGPVYPSGYMVCPDRKTMHVGWTTALGLYYFVGLCSEPDFNYNASINAITDPGIGVCQQEFEPTIIIENKGFEVLSKLEIQYGIDGSIVGSYVWEGNISMYTTENITLPLIYLESEGEHTLEITISNPNDSIDEDTTDNYIQQIFVSNFDGTTVNLDILTDDNPNELIWRIRQGSDILYSVQGYENAGQNNENLCLDTEQCYTLDVFDISNNGMNAGNEGHLIIYWGEEELVNLSGSEYTSDFSTEFCLTQTAIANNQMYTDMKIYPNPANESISVDFNVDNATVKILNVSGEVVYICDDVNKKIKIDVADFTQGVYFVIIESRASVITDKLIIE